MRTEHTVPTAGGGDGAGQERAKPARWPKARRALTIAFVGGVLALLAYQAREVDWSGVVQAMRAYHLSTLLTAAALAAASHAVYCCYDLIGRRSTGHRLPVHRVLGVAFVSYAFNLNFGSLVGGVAMRFRMYSRLGLEAPVITEVLGLSVLTNWLGYAALAGAVFVWCPPALPADWPIGSGALRVFGTSLLVAAVAYLAMCAKARRRHWRLRGHLVTLPSALGALHQVALAAGNWLLMGTVISVLLPHGISFVASLAVLLTAAVAGVIARVPAGLGVLEAVFLALLGQHAGTGPLLAALLAYRAVYYLLPLLPAVVYYFFVAERGERAGTGNCQS